MHVNTPLGCDPCDRKYAHFDPLKEATELSHPEENATNAARAVGKAAKRVFKIEEGGAGPTPDEAGMEYIFYCISPFDGKKNPNVTVTCIRINCLIVNRLEFGG